jgi:hypothetical protein
MTGTLIVVRPGLGVFHPAIAFVLVSAAALAIRQVLSRGLGATEATTLAYTALTATTLLTLPLPFVWAAPKQPRNSASSPYSPCSPPTANTASSARSTSPAPSSSRRSCTPSSSGARSGDS